VLIKGELGPRFRLDISPYDSPVSTALFNIGLPAIPVLVDAIRTTEDEDARHRCSDVAFLILADRQFTIDTLERAKKEAKEDQISRLDQAITWAKTHFKGNG